MSLSFHFISDGIIKFSADNRAYKQDENGFSTAVVHLTDRTASSVDEHIARRTRTTASASVASQNQKQARPPAKIPVKADVESDAYTQQVERQKRLSKVCSSRKSEYMDSFKDSSRYGGKVFAFRDNIAFCRAFKSATTFSIDLLSLLFNCSSTCSTSYTEVYAGLKTKQRIAYVRDRFSFFFVREPYQRLFSVYSNKFYLPKEYWTPVGSDIVAKYRTNPSKTSLQYGHDVTFRELIHYVVDTFENGKVQDKHVTPDYKLCNPCVYNYSFVGKLETFTADWEYLIDMWTSLNYTKPLPEEDMASLLTPNVLSPIKHVFETKKILRNSGIPVKNLFLRTWSYYQIIGLISKKLAMPLIEGNVSAVSVDKFTEIIRTGIEDSKAFGKEVSGQKKEALLQAYSTVPMELLERLQKALSMDCDMFGYDDRPSWVFENQNVIRDFNYFQWI